MGLTPPEIDGRILMLQKQRDDAMNQAVFLAGRCSALESELRELKELKDRHDTPTAQTPA